MAPSLLPRKPVTMVLVGITGATSLSLNQEGSARHGPHNIPIATSTNPTSTLMRSWRAIIVGTRMEVTSHGVIPRILMTGNKQKAIEP